MKIKSITLWIFCALWSQHTLADSTTFIRINQLGYLPEAKKVAVWVSKKNHNLQSWQLRDAASQKIVFESKPSQAFGAYGPFSASYRLDFSSFKIPGTYFLQAENVRSPIFAIDKNVYAGTADFALRYMRQQRCGYNPVLQDSCHNRGVYTLYADKAGYPDSSFLPIMGGWHDASDYLQYSTTTANATYNLLMAYRDFPDVFDDAHAANGLPGKNNLPDIVDEAQWGIDWLMKMFPNQNAMFNQIADDRDHINMRKPALDSQYGRGFQRPVYLVSGEPQQRGKFMNATTGTSSTAAKFASVFSLATRLHLNHYFQKAMEALAYAEKKKGYTQTASVKSPYIYSEENWVDDMELAHANIQGMLLHSKDSLAGEYNLEKALAYAMQEKHSPWMIADTANHYQWYPFVNAGHAELLRTLISMKALPQSGSTKHFSKYADSIARFYREGIEMVWNRASENAFFRGVPFIWCSNNLTVAFAQQCYWYRSLTGDDCYAELEQANIDWLLGCNPWGTSMIYGLPADGDYPEDPHAAFTHILGLPLDGGLVDGPVYGNIFDQLIGIKLYQPDEYAAFQSELAVYHDDYGDYSTNEPTMDGTASLIYLLAAQEHQAKKMAEPPLDKKRNFTYQSGGIIRGDSTQKAMALVFTGHEFADGADTILHILKSFGIKASFFFTGHFYNHPDFAPHIQRIVQEGHYLGPHSENHLLYAPWNKRDSLLITHKTFRDDMKQNYASMKKFGISKKQASYFIPPYEWYNDSISK